MPISTSDFLRQVFDFSLLAVRTVPATTTVAPEEQASTDTYADVADGTVSATGARSVSFTVVNTHATATLKWKVLAANLSDFSDAVEVKAEATVAADGGTDTYSVSQAPYLYYKVQIVDGSGHGTAKVRGVAKG